MAIESEQPTAGYIIFPMKKFQDKWVLYAHYLHPATEIFFLGTCRLRDLYDFSECFRNSRWRKMVNYETPIKVQVLASMDNPIDANKALRMMYDQFRPDANVNGYMIGGKMIISCTEGENAGKTWETSNQCAIENGISAGALSNHLNGRIGYDHVRGMKFKRGLP